MIRALIKQIPGAKRIYFSLLYARSAWQNRQQLKMLASLAAHEQKYVKEVEEIKQNALLNILKYAQAHTVHYRRLIPEEITRDNVDEIMERLPVLTRKDIMEKGDELKSDEFDRLPKICMSTSGTTGIPLKFYRCGDYEFSHQNFLYKYITGNKCSSLHYDKIISFGGCRLNSDEIQRGLFWKDVNSPLYGPCLLSNFYLTEDNLAFYIKEIERLQPAFIRAYPSALLLFVELCQKKHSRVNARIRGIYVTSEDASSGDMRRIAEFFKAPVFGQYGHSEGCLWGFSKNCETRYFCSELYGYVQVVDTHGRQVAEGETGRIVATSYLNTAMPFIKYDTGDLAVYGGHEPGFTILARLIGRARDYIVNSENKKLFGSLGLFDVHGGGMLPAMKHIISWQVVQDEVGKVCLKIVKKDDYTQKDEEEIAQVLKENAIEASFEYVDDIPLTKAGKRKYIIQNIVM